MVTDYPTQGGRPYSATAMACTAVVCFLVVGTTAGGLPPTVDARRYPENSRVPLVATEFIVYGTTASGGGGGTPAGISRGSLVTNTMEPLKQSTARNKAILMVDSADHISGKAGLAAGMTIYLSKDGAVAALITPTVTEISAANMPGHYSLAFTTTHTNTLGDFAVHISATGADPCDFILPVEVERTGLLGAGGVQAIWDALTAALTTVGSVGKRIVDNLDVVLSTRAPESAGNVAAIKTVTDQFTAAQAEPVAVPASNASPLAKLGWIFMLARNKITQTSGTTTVRNNADNANVGSSAVSDDTTTFIRGVWS